MPGTPDKRFALCACKRTQRGSMQTSPARSCNAGAAKEFSLARETLACRRGTHRLLAGGPPSVPVLQTDGNQRA
jgi:hypothetical protein